MCLEFYKFYNYDDGSRPTKPSEVKTFRSKIKIH